MLNRLITYHDLLLTDERLKPDYIVIICVHRVRFLSYDLIVTMIVDSHAHDATMCIRRHSQEFYS